MLTRISFSAPTGTGVMEYNQNRRGRRRVKEDSTTH
jgi:hypothetical protein